MESRILITVIIGLLLLVVMFGMYRAWQLRQSMRKLEAFKQEMDRLKDRGEKRHG